MKHASEVQQHKARHDRVRHDEIIIITLVIHSNIILIQGINLHIEFKIRYL